MEPLGTQIRRVRRRLHLTLDELAVRTAISKPYLSLIETGRVTNPPSDEKLRKLETALGFQPGELVAQAHLQRTPRDIRAVLQRLIEQGKAKNGTSDSSDPPAHDAAGDRRHTLENADGHRAARTEANGNGHAAGHSHGIGKGGNGLASLGTAVNLDDAYLSGVLHEMVGKSPADAAPIRGNPIPVINRVSAGYPKDFTDLGYPPRVADHYVVCPDLSDRDAFAARVSGDSMTPKYQQDDIIIFSPAAAWRDGSDCFVRFEDGQTTFKRVFSEKSDDGLAILRLQPRNERYRPQIVPADEVSGLYKAVYQVRRVDED